MRSHGSTTTTAKGLLLNDPVVRWGFQNNGYARWSDLEAIDTDGVLEHAKDFGLMNGVAISVVSSKSRSIAGFARADRDYTDDEIEALTETLGRLHRETQDLTRRMPRSRPRFPSYRSI